MLTLAGEAAAAQGSGGVRAHHMHDGSPLHALEGACSYVGSPPTAAASERTYTPRSRWQQSDEPTRYTVRSARSASSAATAAAARQRSCESTNLRAPRSKQRHWDWADAASGSAAPSGT